MNKVSVYFTDRQSEALDAKAAQAGVTFAEALRRALDEWLSQKEGCPMPDATTTTTAPVTTAYVKTAYVKLNDEDYARAWRNAEIEEDDYGSISVWRDERVIARFAGADVRSWYMEDPGDQ